jgi:hypothetical protein
MRFSSASEISVVERRFCFRFGDFLVRMCEWYACPRFSLPLAVFFSRLAAPRCVFIFGILILYSFGTPVEPVLMLT